MEKSVISLKKLFITFFFPVQTITFQVKLSGSVSSQYLTALLMAAPLAVGDIEIEIIDKLISVPYVEMTLKLMERFGVTVEHSGSWDRFLVRGGQKYK